MKNYSIIKVGDEYVVKADEKSILKTTSRRRAAKLVTEAAGLLDLQPAPSSPNAEPSIGRDPSKVS